MSKDMRPYLPLFLELILESGIKRGEEVLSHEEVVEQLEADTISVATKIGMKGSSRRFSCGSYSDSAVLAIQVKTI